MTEVIFRYPPKYSSKLDGESDILKENKPKQRKRIKELNASEYQLRIKETHIKAPEAWHFRGEGNLSYPITIVW